MWKRSDSDVILRFNCLSSHIVSEKGSVQFSPSDLVSLMSFVREKYLENTERPSMPRTEDGDMARVRAHCVDNVIQYVASTIK